MDELSEFSSAVVEFKSTLRTDRLNNLVDCCIGTDFVPLAKDASVETIKKNSVATQTYTLSDIALNIDETKLCLWLRKIYPSLEAELLKGPTPLPENSNTNYNDSNKGEYLIQTYQKISLGSIDHSQGLATWLAVHTNNAPVLVLTAAAPHDDWCEHVDQSMKVFTPKRVQAGNFVVYTEVKSVPLKSCLRCLTTNAFNKNIFAGSTVSGDILVWRYKVIGSPSTVEVEQLFCENSPYGCSVAMDWSEEEKLLTCHADGWILQWLVGKQMHLEKSFHVGSKISASHELTSLISINAFDFVVGANDGGVYLCTYNNMTNTKRNIDIIPLRRHLFTVSTLVKRNMSGHVIVISADISGQIYYHDIRNADEDVPNVVVQIPLPFKNFIACSRDGNMIFCPGADGALECYRIQDGKHFIIKGALEGKGNFIKCSENGLWIVTGLYGDEIQIFSVELE